MSHQGTLRPLTVSSGDVAIAAVGAPNPLSVDLLIPVANEGTLAAAARTRMDDIRRRAWVEDAYVARVSSAARSLLRQGTSVRLLLGHGRFVVVRGERSRLVDARAVSWRGLGGNGVDAQAVLTDIGITATIMVGFVTYAVEPLGDALVAVYRDNGVKRRSVEAVDYVMSAPIPQADSTNRETEVLDPQTAAKLNAPQLVNARVIGSGAATRVSLAPGTNVDNGPPYQKVLMVFGPSAGVADPFGAAISVIDYANQAYQNSGFSQTLLLAGTTTVASYNEGSKSTATILDELTKTNDSQMDAVHSLRASFKADLVVYIGQMRAAALTLDHSFPSASVS